jgi:hypothetical protein
MNRTNSTVNELRSVIDTALRQELQQNSWLCQKVCEAVYVSDIKKDDDLVSFDVHDATRNFDLELATG